MTSYKWFTEEEVASWPEGHKKCRGCQEVLPLSAFHKQKQTLLGVNAHCKECRKPRSKASYATRSDEQLLWDWAKSRARKQGVPFTIRVEDIVIPKTCPVLGVELVRGSRGDGSPTLDKFVPELGYVPGNIAVLSSKANRIKSNASAEEIQKVLDWVLSKN